MKSFIGKNSLKNILTIIKGDLNKRIHEDNEFTSDDTLRIYNSITEKDIPNLGSLIHDHDERYYTRNETDNFISGINSKFPELVTNNLILSDVPEDIVIKNSNVTTYGNICNIQIIVTKNDNEFFTANRHTIGTLPSEYRPIFITSLKPFVVGGSSIINQYLDRSSSGVIYSDGTIYVDTESSRTSKELWIDYTYLIDN